MPIQHTLFAQDFLHCIKFVDADVLKRDPNNRYFVEVLKLALSESSQVYGDYRLCPLNTLITQERQLRELEKGKIDVFWTVTSQERESQAKAIRIPLAFGVYGLRVLVINRNHAARTPEEILKKPMLSGTDWPDTNILKTNGFQVDSGHSEHDFLFLTADRDVYAFPRGITEAWAELATVKIPELMVEPTVLLRYPAPMYFFVATQNEDLGNRLTEGLKKATKSGALENLFFSFSWHQHMLQKANLPKRKIVELNNPYLPKSADKKAILELQQRVIDYPIEEN